MNEVLFTVGTAGVSYGTAALAGAGLVIVVLLTAAAFLIARLSSDRRTMAVAEANAEALRATFKQQLAERDHRAAMLEGELSRQREANADLRADRAALEARLAAQSRHAEETLERFVAARQQMTDEFRAIAGDVLKAHGETFSRQNREQVDTLLKPLHDKIVEFHTGLLRDRAAMGENIQALVRSNLQITAEANNLARALKGNAQAQGAWGEMILETILQRSGLIEGVQYFRQQTHTAETGARLRTDVEVVMPNGDRLVVDSKVSLNAFEAWTNCEAETARAGHLQAHLVSLRTHIRTLGEKSYQSHAGTHFDYVLMFVPIEAAFAAAVGADPRLVESGLERGVMLATPTTLMTVLRTVRNVWDIEKRHQNADEIATRAGQLFEKVVGFLGSMDRLDTSLARARQSFDDAKGQLKDGRGNLLRQVEMLRELGAKTSKQLPSGWEDSDAPLLSTGEQASAEDADDGSWLAVEERPALAGE
jgi:DNA recombination protein RmuC